MPAAVDKILAFFALPLTAVIGLGALAAFFVFLYAGPFNWVDFNLSEVQGMALNTLLSLLFFLQHSGMVRRGVRRQLEGFIPPHYQGAVYTIMSGLVLLIFLTLWQGPQTVLFEVAGLPEIIMRGFFLLAVLGTIWGMWALRFVDLFGMDAVVRKQHGEPAAAKSFTVRGPYRWVRHPLYSFTIVFFWTYPVITTDRLLFNILWTIWVIIGSHLEEHELVEDFGDDYRDYQSKVPMLLPLSIHPAWRD